MRNRDNARAPGQQFLEGRCAVTLTAKASLPVGATWQSPACWAGTQGRPRSDTVGRI